MEWDLYTRQGVHLMKDHIEIDSTSNHSVMFETKFNPIDGIIHLDFNVKNSSNYSNGIDS